LLFGAKTLMSPLAMLSYKCNTRNSDWSTLHC